MPHNFSKTPLILSVIIFLLSCSVFLYVFQKINSTNSQSQIKESDWQKETLRLEGIKKLDYSIKIIDNERTQLESHFGRSSDIVPFLDTVEGLAQKASTKAEVVSVDISEDSPPGLLVGMKASGTFSNLYKLLTLLENSPYELEFVLVTMKKGGETDTSKSSSLPQWDSFFKLKLLTFIQ